MDNGTIGILGLLLVNIAAVAYSYGKLSQKVNDLCRRIGRVEVVLNGRKKEEKVP